MMCTCLNLGSASKISGKHLFLAIGEERSHHMDNTNKNTEAANVEIAIGFISAELGRYGYVSGGGSIHSSPLK